MSGIFGIINLNHAPVASTDLSAMADALKLRGPDDQSIWHDGAVGVGHALLATTESALFEHLPFRDTGSGCVITADARIDNREELMAALGVDPKGKFVGDGELILRAYLKWGGASPEHLMGDFAFAVWDPRSRELFCARDHFGMRPFIYYHVQDNIFAFASSVSAVLALKQVPRIINEARIADFLQNPLEGIDTVSTFYKNVYRLSPTHSLCVSDSGIEIGRYWRLQPGPMLNLASDEDYAEAFLDVFTAAVKSRLVSENSARSTLGSMLSGGMDSGSVVAIASRIFTDQGLPPLKTFSAIGPDSNACIETRSIHDVIGSFKVDPQLLNYAELSPYLQELRASTIEMDEPFDGHMSLIRLIYLAAHHMGIKVMLDGVSGDNVLTEGMQMGRLIRSGRWTQAYNDAIGLKHFYGDDFSALRVLFDGARIAFTPNWARRLKRSLLFGHNFMAINPVINPAFARRVNLTGRLEQLALHNPKQGLSDADERAHLICHPFLVVGRERYDRIASVYGIEPRDPFLDRRLVDFCLRIPSRKFQAGGWPKLILRQAMSDRLPDQFRWKLGRQHLGTKFTSKVFLDIVDNLELNDDDLERLNPYLAPDLMRKIREGQLCEGADSEILSLVFWLRKVL